MQRPQPNSFVGDMADDSPVDQDEEHSEFDIYGKTPPRTRLLRKNRERKQRDKEQTPDGLKSPAKSVKPKKAIRRRNTVSNIFDELMAKADSTDSEHGKKMNKRSMKLLRGSERDLKLDITSAQMVYNYENNQEEIPQTPQPSVQVETCKRFLSLCSRRIACSKAKTQVSSLIPQVKNEVVEDDNSDCPQGRVEFHRTLSLLIRMGCGEKSANDRNPRRHMSREEFLWQNELKDLIWLELQAWHADRTPTEQDEYLCTARESVANLLNDIMTYRFQKHTKSGSDSGLEDDCSGCLSMFCHACIEAQNDALRDIEKLLSRLEAAESLFSSSKAFAELYPVYNSPEFVARVKAMCLWYNMTRHQRLKLVILGRMLVYLENKYEWPLLSCCDVNSSVDSTSPSESNSSNSSADYLNEKISLEILNVSSITSLGSRNKDKKLKSSPYRKYIENVLKTRGLTKSLNFLERLHEHLLRKAQITLEKPKDESIFYKIPTSDSEEEELCRYGYWSPESQALGLPSYKASFLFLSTVPLEVIHEFLRMRLDQKPENPSPLSVRQLMRELKEGLKIATMQRQRILKYIYVAIIADETEKQIYTEKMRDYDNSLLQVFNLYLDYLEEWALLRHDTFQKRFLEDELNFCCLIVVDIPGGTEAAGEKFTAVLDAMLKSITETLLGRIEELAAAIQPKQDFDYNEKQSLFAVCREIQSLFNDERERSIKTIAFFKMLVKSGLISLDGHHELKKAIVAFKCTIPQAIEKVQAILDISTWEKFDETEKASLNSRCREILQQGYRFGFEFYKEMSEFVPRDHREKLSKSMVQFANLWMKYVKERCERGRGMRPRWAYQGLEFLLTVCEPKNTKHLLNEEFEELKNNMDTCISHVIGTAAPTTPESGFHSASPRNSLDHVRSFPRSRGSSPSPRATYKSQRSNISISRKTSTEQLPSFDQLDASPTAVNSRLELPIPEILIKLQPVLRTERIYGAIEHLDTVIDERLKDQDLIGKVVTFNKEPTVKSHIRRRYVTFTWQRGIKIGQGRFGKVYTAVNNNTGEMMAVKEIALQHNDVLTFRRVGEELKILEGISHKNLVKYYGIEVHREEMLIFMEFCAEGTIENLVAGTENGLPELLIRRYTYQLLSGVAELHAHGIVHRDIKSANIFLTDEGNCLKIGDFGCAVKIKANTTLPGELQGFVGTQAYMAPEVFMKTSGEGHGRAADIWSVGCVVVEMASGKRPWVDYDSNYQIMFKVGMGQRPEAPDSLIDEGHDFLDQCLQHNARDRATAIELLDHPFVKVGDDLI